MNYIINIKRLKAIRASYGTQAAARHIKAMGYSIEFALILLTSK